MRRLTEAQRRFLRFLAGDSGQWFASVANITWDRLQRGGFITGSARDPRITLKGRAALAPNSTEGRSDRA
ncbi:hypothetical protein ACUXK4_004839 [Methylorubrum extorquens]